MGINIIEINLTLISKIYFAICTKSPCKFCSEGKFISTNLNGCLMLLRASSIWPLGLICCFGLILFLIVTSIVLALIPLYLPQHDSDLQRVSSRK
jgi:hypothetical protein